MGNLCSSSKDTAIKPKNQTGTRKEKKSDVNEEAVGFFNELPRDAEEVTVDHAYDGDTITIVRKNGEKRRVRFLGIDAPELKEKEAFAQESANYMKQLCRSNATVWLSFEANSQTDKYDRLLAYVYVSNPTGGPGFYCVNICMLQEGLAFFYSTKNEYLSLRLLLLSAQRHGIEQKKNLWKTVDLDKQVFITRNGTAFHDYACQHIQNANLCPLTVAAAFDRGLSPCRTCHPA